MRLSHTNTSVFFAFMACFSCGVCFSMDMTPRPCSGWNTARKANLSTVVQREWVYGYLTGLSDTLKTHAGKDIHGLLPANEDIVSQLNNYCEIHPQDSVNKALLVLIDRLFEQR
jgi:hypothetical protein